MKCVKTKKAKAAQRRLDYCSDIDDRAGIISPDFHMSVPRIYFEY